MKNLTVELPPELVELLGSEEQARRDAKIAVVWDAHLGGHPVSLLGFESKPLPRLGFVPVYGPEQWTGGTLFPLAAKKVARAINAASGSRPLVVLANLSGFDGSPESMRQWQLEYGAEVGRAVVNFRGPIVFCVVSRYHGGAFVVFSNALHDNLEVAALDGAHASAAPRPRRSSSPARSTSAPAGTRAWSSSSSGSPIRRRPTRRSCAAVSRRRGRACAPRSWARSPRSSTGSTASSAPGRWAPSTTSCRPSACAPT